MPRRNSGPRLRWLAKRGCWYIVWTERGRSRERSTGTTDRARAEIALAEFLQARDRCAGPRDPSQVLVTDLLNEYLQERGPKVAAPERIAFAVLKLTDFWEAKSVAEVTPYACGGYGASRSCSDGTVRRELGVLRAAINHGHRSGRLTRPVSVDLPDRPEPRNQWLSRNAAAALLRAARTKQARLYLPLFILIGLYTGRRKEAILSLRWSQVDLGARLIDFEVAGRKRTNKRRGRVPIPARLFPHLERARRRGTDLGHVIHRNGEPLKDIKKGFRAACDRAQLEAVSPHTLRHTAATWLMQAGTDPWQASGFLAMSMETLMRTYGHHHPDYMRDAAEAIGRRPQNVRAIG